MSNFKSGQTIQMIAKCKDNPNIIEGQKGTIDFVNYDGCLNVEFEYPVTGNGIMGNGMNSYNWFIDPKQAEILKS